MRCRRRQPTWSTHDLIEEFDPPRPETDLPSEPVLDAVAKACEIACTEMSQCRKVALHYGVDLSDAAQCRLARVIASDRAPTKMRLKAQVASRLNQLRDTNLRPR
jgi:hypothetical protein